MAGSASSRGGLDIGGLCSRVCIMFLTILLAMSTIAYIALSIMLLVKYNIYQITDKNFLHGFNILINVYLFIYCLLGYIGFCLKQDSMTRWFLMLSFINLVIMFVYVIAIDVTLANGSTRESLEDDFLKLVKQYKNSPESEAERVAKRAMDDAQSYFRCCGSLGKDDYKNMTGTSLPASCGSNTEGCAKRLFVMELFLRMGLTADVGLWFVIAMLTFCGYQMGRTMGVAPVSQNRLLE